jgi:hypothetical protein
MKTKITLLLFILPFFTFAQGPWEFNTASNTEGWVGATTQVNVVTASTTTVSQSGTSLIVQTTATSTGRNPNINKPSAGIAIATSNRLGISLKNNSLATFIRFWVSVDGGALNNNIVPGIEITASDATFKTYVAVLSGVASTSTITQIYLEFRTGTGPNGTNYTPAAPAPTIEIDYIRPFQFVTPIRNVFNFNTASDVEGFTTLTRATAIQATDGPNGTLKMTATAASTLDSKVALNAGTFTVDGTTNKYAHITLKNSSTNTRLMLTASGINYLPIQAYTISDGSYKTYDFDLSTWTGNQQPEFAFSVQTTWLATATYAVNDVVVFQNSNYRNLTSANSGTGLNPKTDAVNWVLVGTEGGLLDITNSIFIDNIIFDNVAVVPTKFSAVYASAKNKIVEVTWNTYNESNVKGYYVQRSTDGMRFSDLFFVTANNLEESKYTFTDRTISTDAIVYYRIKSLDNDGTISFSSVVKINLQNTNSRAISLVNPVKGKTLQMQLNSLQKGNYQVKVQSLEGSTVVTKNLPVQNASSSVSFSLPSNIAKGFYVLTVIGNDFNYAAKILIE